MDKMNGILISEEEASKGLGFTSVEDFRYFQEHINVVTEIVKKSLDKWFGPKNRGQIEFEIASRITDYFMKQKTTAKKT